jgi:hypothetical protein
VTDNTLIGWQPIESAPTEWEPVLVWAISEAEMEDAEDEEREPVRACHVARHSSIQPGNWWLSDTLARVLEPTHWMPLPAPPQ